MIQEAKWTDSHHEWKEAINQAYAWEDGFTGLAIDMCELPVSARAQAAARAAFYAAADYNTLFEAPLPQQIHAWAEVFEPNEWLTPALAMEAVRRHMGHSEDGSLLPSDVLHRAARIGR